MDVRINVFVELQEYHQRKLISRVKYKYDLKKHDDDDASGGSIMCVSDRRVSSSGVISSIDSSVNSLSISNGSVSCVHIPLVASHCKTGRCGFDYT
ncbi:unnamed protein product [Schistosoma margrebowiei]|uniref:Uncharacterized protein n=1 Tax=Schistosoma margrebowiei TaxID=48269 RepID=A0A183N219_9TREM|nr:unnamed protein product [Schistosoma margrebowiei]